MGFNTVNALSRVAEDYRFVMEEDYTAETDLIFVYDDGIRVAPLKTLACILKAIGWIAIALFEKKDKAKGTV